MQNVRVYEMPDCKMVSSGIGMFGEEKFEAFDKWMSSQKRDLVPKDFLSATPENIRLIDPHFSADSIRPESARKVLLVLAWLLPFLSANVIL